MAKMYLDLKGTFPGEEFPTPQLEYISFEKANGKIFTIGGNGTIDYRCKNDSYSSRFKGLEFSIDKDGKTLKPWTDLNGNSFDLNELKGCKISEVGFYMPYDFYGEELSITEISLEIEIHIQKKIKKFQFTQMGKVEIMMVS